MSLQQAWQKLRRPIDDAMKEDAGLGLGLWYLLTTMKFSVKYANSKGYLEPLRILLVHQQKGKQSSQ